MFVYLPIYLPTLNLVSQVAKCMFSNSRWSKVLSEYGLACYAASHCRSQSCHDYYVQYNTHTP